MIRNHMSQLNANLEKAQSQFQVRMCYVNAHDELHEMTKHIVENLDMETE